MRIVSGRFRGRKLATVDGPGMRPAMGKVREALFSMLAARGVDFSACRALDLFAGSGAVGIEALSRGAPEAWFVENSAAVAAVLRKNLKSLGVAPHQGRVVDKDVAAFLKKTRGENFDLIFIDPPYGKGLLLPALQGICKGGFAAQGCVIAAEVEPALEPGPKELPSGLVPMADRIYGQTRIYLWRLEIPA